jgi:type VI secretion system protein
MAHRELAEQMPLTLKITSKQKHILGADSVHVFSVHGGTVGRAPDNDWVLPDPDRYISARHAIVDYQGGAYYLTDSSTNGVFVNDSDQPVGKGTPLRLYDGDRLRMGDYQFLARIVNVSADGTEDTGVFIADDADDPETPEDPGTGDLRVLEHEALTRPDPEARIQVEEAAIEPDLSELSLQDTGTSAAAEPDDHRATRPYSGDAPDLTGNSPFADPEFTPEDFGQSGIYESPGDGASNTRALAIIMEAAGLDPSRLPPGREQQTLITIGHFIRATAEGTINVLRTRSLVKAQFRLSQTTIQPKENNPLKFSPNAEEALKHLFYKRPADYLPPVEAVEEALEDVRAHQAATVVAMRASFRDLLDRFDPETLEDKFNRGLKRGALLKSSNKSKFWDLYRDYYQVIAGHSDENFANIAGPRFADAFDEEMRRLTGRAPTDTDSLTDEEDGDEDFLTRRDDKA